MALVTIAKPTGIKQLLASGSNWTGVAPDDGSPLVPTFGDDIFAYTTATTAGLFDPTNTAYPFEAKHTLLVARIELHLANQTSWKIERKDVHDDIALLYAGTTETYFNIAYRDSFILLWGSRLLVTTVGATSGAMSATIIFTPYRSRGF